MNIEVLQIADTAAGDAVDNHIVHTEHAGGSDDIFAKAVIDGVQRIRAAAVTGVGSSRSKSMSIVR